jgi:hypothetical protein
LFLLSLFNIQSFSLVGRGFYSRQWNWWRKYLWGKVCR